MHELRYVDNITNRFISFQFRLYEKVESFVRTVCFVSLFKLLAERRRNNCIETK